MADQLVMLALSPTMEEGQLVKWLKNEGDEVESGDVVAEVETDKATMELESFLDGVLLKQLVSEGSMVTVGDPIAVIGEEGEDISDLEEQGGGDTDDDDGEGDPEEDRGDDDDSEGTSDERSQRAPASPTQPSTGDRIIASPLARKMASEHDLDLASIDGSGPRGRIIKRDIEAALERGDAGSSSDQPAASLPEPFTPAEWAEDVEPEPLSSMRRTIATRLTQSWVQAPHFFLEMSVRMDAAYDLRKQINASLQARDRGKVSFNDLVIKACALALQESPAVNVAFAPDGMRRFSGSHIGVAVAVPDGLVVPVVRDAENKSLSAIAGDVRDLAGRARDKKLKPEEMTGSTFSISNLGMYGIDRFTAVINPPEACILAVGAMKKMPVVEDDDTIGVGRVMQITMSCDHRAVDGATGAEFLGIVRAYLEDPLLLLA